MFGSAGRAYGSKAGLLCPSGVCGSLGMSADSMRVGRCALRSRISGGDQRLKTVCRAIGNGISCVKTLSMVPSEEWLVHPPDRPLRTQVSARLTVCRATMMFPSEWPASGTR
jgi:hypothetical protein